MPKFGTLEAGIGVYGQPQGRSCHSCRECGPGLPISCVTSAASVFVLVQKVALASARKMRPKGALQEA